MTGEEMSRYVNVKKKTKTTRPHNVQRHAGCRNKHISSSTVEDSQDLQSLVVLTISTLKILLK